MIVPLGASVYSNAVPPELTFKCLSAVNDQGVSVNPKNVVVLVSGGICHEQVPSPSALRNLVTASLLLVVDVTSSPSVDVLTVSQLGSAPLLALKN